MIKVNETWSIRKYAHGYELIETKPGVHPITKVESMVDHKTWPGTFAQCCNAIIEKSIGDEGDEIQELKSIVGRINEVRAEIFAACKDGGKA